MKYRSVSNKFLEMPLFFSVLLLISCNRVHIPENLEIESRVIKTIHIDKDSMLLGYYPKHQCFETDSFWGIIGYNKQTHCLDYINPDYGTCDYRMLLDDKGLNIPPGFNDFKYVSLDSIFFSYDEYQLILLNARDSSYINYDLKKRMLARCRPVMGFHLTTLPGNQKVIFHAPYYQELFYNKYYKSPIVGVFDTQSDTLIKRFGLHPKAYRKLKKLYPIMDLPSIVEDGHSIYLSFGPCHEMYKYSIESGELLLRESINSNYMLEELKPIPRNCDFQIGIDYLIENSFYYKLLFDRQGSNIYRLVKHAQPLRKTNGEVNNRWEGFWSIIILDQNLNVLGESIFPESYYNYLFSFVCKDGLCVARRVPDEGDSLTLDIIGFNL